MQFVYLKGMDLRLDPNHLALLLACTSLVCSVFTFCIALFTAQKLGQRMQREVYVGTINKKYFDVRQIAVEHRNLSRNDVFLKCLRDAKRDIS